MVGSETVKVTVLLPGLFDVTAQQWLEHPHHAPQLPGLSALLNRCRRTSKRSSSFESLLAEKFAFTTSTTLPVAALTYLRDKNAAPRDFTLRADPVYLKADRDRLYMLGYDNLKVTLEEAQTLAAEINRVYADDGWSLEVGAPDRWYICLGEKPLVETFPLNEVFGKSISGYLPVGKEEKKWRVLLTELQMLLHNSGVNEQRAINHQIPINSVWLWGEGRLPARPAGFENRFDFVWSNDALCLGLSQWAGCEYKNLPLTASEWIKQTAPGRHLIVVDDLRMLAKENIQDWVDKWLVLDENWFTPLKEAFDKSLMTHLQFEFESGMVFECGKHGKWNKWWRKKRLWYEWA